VLAPEVTVVTPVLNIDKSAPSTSDSSRTITYDITVRHDVSSEIDAFDLLLTDDLATNNMQISSFVQVS
jgi:hypothetical protein